MSFFFMLCLLMLGARARETGGGCSLHSVFILLESYYFSLFQQTVLNIINSCI